MKRIYVMLTLAVSLLMLLAGCGESDTKLTETFDLLLAQDQEAYYIFYGGGMPVSAAGAVTVGDAQYYPVTSEQYPTMADLQGLLEATYGDSVEIGAILGRTGANGALLFIEQDGILYKNADEQVSYSPYSTVEGTMTISERTNTKITFTFEETGEGGRYSTTLAMAKTGDGWRLSRQRVVAVRTLLEAATEEAPGEELFANGAARQTAEDFLQALLDADTAAIESLCAAEAGTYSSWSSLEVSRAEIGTVYEDLDFQGDYLVELEVTDGAGVLEEGTVRYRLRVGMVNAIRSGLMGTTDSLSVDYFKPAELSPYQLEDDHNHSAANAVERLISFFGPLEFESPEDLGGDRLTEYLLMNLDDAEAAPYYTLEQVQAEALRIFNIREFEPDQSYLVADGEGYAAGGRGLIVENILTFPGPAEDGEAEVEVYCYSDPLQTDLQQVLVYSLVQNRDGSWEFVSATADENNE